MTAEATSSGQTAGQADPDRQPSWTPAPSELADLELILTGAFSPLTGFLTDGDLAEVAEHGSLADGRSWPIPVTITVPDQDHGGPALDAGRADLVLCDEECVPLAVLTVTERVTTQAGIRLAGPVTALRAAEHGPFRRLRRTPGQVRELLAETRPGAPVLAIAVREPPHRRLLAQIRHVAGNLEATVLVLPLAFGPRASTLVRAVLATRDELPAGALIVPVPLAPRTGGTGEDAAHDTGAELLGQAHVAAAYGATHLLVDVASGTTMGDSVGVHAPLTVVVPGTWTFDDSVDVWRPVDKVATDHARPEPTGAELLTALDRGDDIPDWVTPPKVAAVLRAAYPPRRVRGLTVFFTGLSGSGKSTLAKNLADALAERGRSVSLLDGDVVRRMLSAGLTFSRADRDLNITRIGYVAAEITRHGGVAICAPIAPYAATRSRVREMVGALGDFLLVHVATPLAVCEARDRKGLYAKARAGLIGGFTGISDPYERPEDADLVLDTSTMTRDEAVSAVLGLLVEGGWVSPDAH